MPDRRAEPAVVHRFSRRLLVFDLSNQLAFRITQRVRDVRVLGDCYERRKAGQNRAQYNSLLLAAAVMEGDVYRYVTRIPLA
jgi:hypothetical protein